mmetsp:Transcript_1084/g.2604  ORF Transcript_1084/g.2604 Transcript_1084/m.2604 type:complete len:238 (+) Transcript_1084:2-715(+)
MYIWIQVRVHRYSSGMRCEGSSDLHSASHTADRLTTGLMITFSYNVDSSYSSSSVLDGRSCSIFFAKEPRGTSTRASMSYLTSTWNFLNSCKTGHICCKSVRLTHSLGSIYVLKGLHNPFPRDGSLQTLSSEHTPFTSAELLSANRLSSSAASREEELWKGIFTEGSTPLPDQETSSLVRHRRIGELRGMSGYSLLRVSCVTLLAIHSPPSRLGARWRRICGEVTDPSSWEVVWRTP